MRYYQNARQNRAALILAAFPLDLVREIIELAQTQGATVITKLADDASAPPKPFAIFSSNFINEEDFEDTWYGFLTCQLYQMSTFEGDAEKYKQIMMKAFSVPEEIAQAAAVRIETYDPVDVDSEGKKLDWYKRWWNNTAEVFRRIVNIPATVFNTGGFMYNDQDQSHDVDWLYEMNRLGVEVKELAKRNRLIIAHLRNVGVPSAGDPYGDPAGVSVVRATAPLTGNRLPAVVYGGLAPLKKKGLEASTKQVRNLLSSAGLTPNEFGQTKVVNPELRQAVLDLCEGKPGPLAQLDREPSVNEARLLYRISDQPDATAAGTYEAVVEEWGEPIADAWASGDIGAMLNTMREEATTPLPSTGDPEADRAIDEDASREVAEGGDPLGVHPDSEVGFLFFGSKKKRRAKKARQAYLRQLEDSLRFRNERMNMMRRYAQEAGGDDVDQLYRNAGINQQYDQFRNVGTDPVGAWPPTPLDPLADRSVNYNANPLVFNTASPSMGATGLPGEDPNMLGMFPVTGPAGDDTMI